MGIKHLWSILTPYCERKPLYELQGKTVAVDLSCWVCEAQNISEYSVQPRMYLRNLYFRTSYLLLMETYPIFVLEGKAPELKYDTIASRNAVQFKGAKPKTDGIKTGKDRTRFHFTLQKCQEMLKYMGLACLVGEGEAESFCAFLNESGIVDGCISQDSDCFAYGAQIVYRNFSIASQGAHSASGGAVDVYDIRKVKSSIEFGRNKIIALALICGSDYSDGINGLGKDSAMKLFENLKDDEVLDRLRSWKNNESLFANFEKTISDKNICTSCGHNGRLQSHNKIGCNECGTTKGCDFSKFKDERLYIKNELNMRNKALQDVDFPNENLIREYLICKDKISKIDTKWKQPDLVKFVKFTAKYLSWEEIYTFEKFLPILTRWQLLNYESMNRTGTDKPGSKGVVDPNYVKKVRNPKGIPSYEILWQDKENHFKGLIPEEQLLATNDMDKLWSTIEPQHLVNKAYPDLVAAYLQSKIKPKKASRRKQKPCNALDEINDMLINTSISEPVTKKVRKPKQKEKNKGVDDLETSMNELSIKKKKTKTNTIDTYFKKAVINSSRKADVTSTPKSKVVLDFDPDMSRFGDEDDDENISDIIDSIAGKKLPHCLNDDLNNELEKLGLELCEDMDKQLEENGSCFFSNSFATNDLFEKTFDNKYCIESSNDSMDGADCVNFSEDEQNERDSFSVEYFGPTENEACNLS